MKMKKQDSTRLVTPKPRHIETYKLWHEDKLTLEEISNEMSIKPVSALWNLVSCFSTVEGSLYSYDDQRFLDTYDTFVDVPQRLQDEAAGLIAEIRARQKG